MLFHPAVAGKAQNAQSDACDAGQQELRQVQAHHSINIGSAKAAVMHDRHAKAKQAAAQQHARCAHGLALQGPDGNACGSQTGQDGGGSFPDAVAHMRGQLHGQHAGEVHAPDAKTEHDGSAQPGNALLTVRGGNLVVAQNVKANMATDKGNQQRQQHNP